MTFMPGSAHPGPGGQTSPAGGQPPRRRGGVGFNLRLSLFGIAALVILTLILVFLTFTSVSHQYSKINDQAIPTIEQANRLTALARSIDSLARNMPNLHGAFALGSANYQLKQLTQDLGEAIAQLDVAVVGTQPVEEVKDTFRLVAQQIDRLYRLVWRRNQEESRQTERVRAMGELYEAIESFGALMVNSPAPPITWIHLIVAMMKGTELLTASLATPDPALVVSYKNDFNMQLMLAKMHLPQDDGRLRRPAEALVETLEGSRSIFDERLAQLRLELSAATAIKSLAVMDRLIHQVGAMSTRLSRGADETADQVDLVIRRLLLALGGISIVCALGLAAILVYINRRIVARMRALQEGMLLHVEGVSRPISTAGSDEISDMARSFMFYVDEVDRREKALQARTRELDETLRELTEKTETLNATMSRLQSIAANIPGAIFQARVGPEGELVFLYASAGSQEHFGLSPEALVKGERRLEIHPEDQARFKATLSQAIEKNQDLDFVGRLYRPDGERKWLRLAAKPAREEGGGSTFNGLMLDVTRRKLAEQERLASDRKIKAMSQAIDDALVMLDGQGRVRFWNQAAERLFGYSAEEAMDLDFHALAAPPGDREKAEEGLRRFARTGRGVVFGTTIQTTASDRQGREFPVEVTISPFQVDEEWFAVGSVRDITARQRAEEAIRESEERYRELLETVACAIIRLDHLGTITFFNSYAEKLFGFSKGEIVGQNIVGTIVPETESSGRELRRMIQEIVRAPERYEHNENENIHRDGRRLWMSWTNKGLYDKAGQVREVLCIGSDLTGRKRAETEIRDAKKLMEDIIDSLPFWLSVKDREGRYLVVNQLMAREHGRTVEAFLGKTTLETTELQPGGLAKMDERDQRVLATGHPLEVPEYTVGGPDGPRFRRLLKVPWRSEAGVVRGVISWSEDITDRKKVEEKLKRYVEDLERFNRLTVGREERMIELKEEINDLLEKLGQGKKYKIVDQAEMH